MDMYAKLKELEERVEALEQAITPEMAAQPFAGPPLASESIVEVGAPFQIPDHKAPLAEDDDYEADTENAEEEGGDEEGPIIGTGTTYDVEG